MLFALSRVAKDREMFLENYWLKNKRAVAKGKTGPVDGLGDSRRTSTRVRTPPKR